MPGLGRTRGSTALALAVVVILSDLTETRVNWSRPFQPATMRVASPAIPAAPCGEGRPSHTAANRIYWRAGANNARTGGIAAETACELKPVVP